MQLQEFVSLAQKTTFKIGGAARYVARIAGVDDLYELASHAGRLAMPVVVLGGGSNILADDEGFEGIVAEVVMSDIDWQDDGATVQAVIEAGASWDGFVGAAVRRGLWGVENLSGIPGTMGGAVVQNIGAYGAELSDILEWVEAFHLPSQRVRRLTRAECAFGYRDSVWKKKEGHDLVVFRAALRLAKKGIPNIAYKDLARHFAGMDRCSIGPADVRAAVLEIRKAKFPDLTRYGTAGSFFKNPVIANSILERMLTAFPHMPFHPLGAKTAKLSAAWLIDNVAGLRGKRIGDVGTWSAQALVVVNYGGATARDVRAFAEMIRKSVKEKTEIVLEPEVIVMMHSQQRATTGINGK